MSSLLILGLCIYPSRQTPVSSILMLVRLVKKNRNLSHTPHFSHTHLWICLLCSTFLSLSALLHMLLLQLRVGSPAYSCGKSYHPLSVRRDPLLFVKEIIDVRRTRGTISHFSVLSTTSVHFIGLP